MVVCKGFNTFVLRKKHSAIKKAKKHNNFNIIKQPWEERLNTEKRPK